MTIGRMTLPVLNEPRNAWYEKRNHIRIPAIAESAKYVDAAFTGVGLSPDVIFDSLDVVNAHFSNFSDTYLQMGDVSIMDDSGRPFARFVSPDPLASDASMWLKWNYRPPLKDGRYRALVRMSGTEPGITAQRGPELLIRTALDAIIGPGTENGYAVGPWAYSGSQRQRIRKLVDGTITSVMQLGTNPPFAHNEWFWIDATIHGSIIRARLYKDGDPIPTNPQLWGNDATFDSDHGQYGFDGRFSLGLTIDLAELHYEYVAQPDIELVGIHGAASNAAVVTDNEIGDLILLYDSTNTATTVPSQPSGFSNVRTRSTTSSGATSMRVSRRLATAADETIAATEAAVGFRIAMVFRNVDPVTPVQTDNGGTTWLDTDPNGVVSALSGVSPPGKIMVGLRARGVSPTYDLTTATRRFNLVGASTNGQSAVFEVDGLQSSYAGETFANSFAGKGISWALALNQG